MFIPMACAQLVHDLAKAKGETLLETVFTDLSLDEVDFTPCVKGLSLLTPTHDGNAFEFHLDPDWSQTSSET